MTNKKVLITGGTGLIGREVLNILTNTDYEIYVIQYQTRMQNAKDIHVIQANLLNQNDVNGIFEHNCFDSLIHLAWYGDKKVHSHNINYDWLENSLFLIRKFVENGGKKLLCAGSISEYDFKYGYFTEGITPLENMSLYGKCKSSLFNATSIYCKNNNVDFKWARIFNLFGNFERKERLIPYVINACLNNEDVRVSDCLKFQDYLHAYDVANAIMKLFESDIEGAVNISSGKPVQLRYIVNKIAELTNFKGNILWGAIPAAFGDEVVVGNNEKLKSIGWEPKYTLEEGLKQTIDWWKNNNNENNKEIK